MTGTGVNETSVTGKSVTENVAERVTEIVVISAVAKNNVIGKNNDIPWRIKEDFQHFKSQTLGHPCIMGDKTYESLPDNAKPLPGRENIILTFDRNYRPEGVTLLYDFNEALDYCRQKKAAKAFICGGATIYRLGLKVADTLMLTRIYKDVDGDVFFPEINFDEWAQTSRMDSKDEKHGPFSFITYRRIAGKLDRIPEVKSILKGIPEVKR